jgi:hypothetical protein
LKGGENNSLHPHRDLKGGEMPEQPTDEVLSREEVLTLLSRKAREGNVAAMVAVERALRLGEREEEDEVAETIDRILGENRLGTVA